MEHSKIEYTRDAALEFLHDELEDFDLHVPFEKRDSAFFRKWEIVTYAHNAMQDMPLNDTMQEYICENGLSSLTDIFEHWQKSGMDWEPFEDKMQQAKDMVQSWIDSILQTIENLRLDERSLIYSVVELVGEGQSAEFLAPGIVDSDNLADLDDYLDFVDQLVDDTDISVHVRSYSVGCGESERADDDALAYINKHKDELEEKYGIDFIKSDDFTDYGFSSDPYFDDDEEQDEGMEP